MPRFFTLDQARRALPDVERAIREALALKAAYQEAESELRDLALHVTVSGGASLDPLRLSRLRSTRESHAAQLQATVDRIHQCGCLVKDLDIGLLDFPTLYRGREVYLCWRLGERDIEHWHGVDEGFRGRKPVNAEFLAHHQGDSPEPPEI